MRLALSGIVGLACLLALSVGIPQAKSEAQGPDTATTRIVERQTPTACDDAARAMGIDPGNAECPNAAEPPPGTEVPDPVDHGSYRLVPDNWQGSLAYEDRPDMYEGGKVTNDLAEIEASSLHAAPTLLPDGYRLSAWSTNGEDSEHVVDLTYTGPGAPIHVSRVRRFTWPRELIMPTGATYTVFEKIELRGLSGTLYYPEPGSRFGSPLTVLSFADGDIETNVYGERVEPAVVVGIAESIPCASCQDGAVAMREIVSFSAGGSGGASQARSSVPVAAAGATTASAPLDEYRVLEGLELSKVVITSWWNHPPSFEYPLDLDKPGGGSGNIPVNFVGYPWNGSQPLHVVAEEYSLSTSCTGRYIRLIDSNGVDLGRLMYVHLQSQIAVGASWNTNTLGYTIQPLGTVATSQPCTSWTGEHLHQGQETSAAAIAYNDQLPGVGGFIEPTSDAFNKWLHKVTSTVSTGIARDHITDANGDGYSEADELTAANCGYGCANFRAFGTAETATCKDANRNCGTPGAPATEYVAARNAPPPANGYGCLRTLDTVGPLKTVNLARADIDLDGSVSILDLSKVGGWMGNPVDPSSSDPRWEGNLDGDGAISILDLSAMASNFYRSVAGNCKVE